MNTKRIIDANIILRYILRDNDNDFEIVKGYHRKEEKFVMQFQKNEKNLNFWNGYNNTMFIYNKKGP